MNRRAILFLLIFVLPCVGWSQQKYWIYFTDKGYAISERSKLLANERASFPQRTLERRGKILPKDGLLAEDDLPLFKPYLRKLDSLGIRPIIESRWLNAVSAVLTDEQVTAAPRLAFVREIKPVMKFQKTPLPESTTDFLSKPQIYKFDYGASLDQNEMMHVPEVHELGLDGNGILIGMMDTGFDYQFHEAFSRLRVLAEYDFINQDSTTRNEPDDNDASSQQNHGTNTLAVVGGFKEGQLIGPAFGASYLLAKTEVVSSETPIEEDYWVAGIEWLERRGADVVNSSLGYNDWYTYQDMNGRTAVTTIAADKAVEKGVVVVNSMGNEGNKSWRHMIAPADGFHVIAAGAVYSTGDLVGFSSRGPTYDGRTKPDVVAMGAGVQSVQVGTVDSYSSVSGTSFSSPLTAGVTALILQAHPYLTPFELRDALRNTADRAKNPDNDYGWGLVNAYEAIFYHGLFFSRTPEIDSDAQAGHRVRIKIFAKNELKDNALFAYYATAGQSFTSVALVSANKPNEYEAWLPLQSENTLVKFYFSAMDVAGDVKFHPHNAPDAYFTFTAFDTTVTPVEPPKKFALDQNYPNPFDRFTTITYEIFESGNVTLVIYNIKGEQVWKLADNEFHYQTDSSYRKSWDGRDDHGKFVASGIYFYRLKSGNSSAVKRMVFLREKQQ